MCTIMPRTDELVCPISVENSCKARIVRAQPRRHSAVGGAGEYCRLRVEAKNMGRKTWHKILYAKYCIESVCVGYL
jgi:hypothetical protein